ncbi:MAG: hypothetical protein ACI9HY_000670 [Planctomycetaceae bacterium]|jgi:hypothetical protein
MNAYRSWLDIEDEVQFASPVQQSIEEFIRCQHSRDTFAVSRLKNDLALLEYAVGGLLHFSVRSKLTWGKIAAI